MARTLHIEELCERVNQFQLAVRRAVVHGHELSRIKTRIEEIQREFQKFLEEEHGIFLDWTPRE